MRQFLIFWSVVFWAGAVGAASMETVNTRNFDISLERSVEHRRPTAKEVGILVERLCAQLDKIFSKYAPHRVADEMERLQKAEAEGKKYVPSKNREVDEEDPDRVIPKCRIYIFNDRESFAEQCRADGIEPSGDAYAGFFTSKTNSIYMMRSNSLQQTRQTILHETTHYYTFNFLPGGARCYPEWFHEGLAMSYEKHTWNGDKLVIGTPPRVQIFDAPASAIVGLQRFRTFSTTHLAGTPAPSGENGAGVPAKSTRKGETVIDPGLIQPFLETMFTPEEFQKERIPIKDPNEPIAHRYAMYQVFGRFLLFARPDHLGAVLRQIALWEKEKSKKFPRKDWFVEAWKIAAEKKPITVEEIGRWAQKNQLPFQWTFGDWQDIGDQIAGKAQEDRISILALSSPKALPKFTVYPKNTAQNGGKFQVGVVINFVDSDNFGAVVVDEKGAVIQMEQRGGSWTGGKIIGKAAPIADRNNPYDNGVAFQFAVAQQGGMIAVQINQTVAGTYPKNPDACCGFFLSSTEAIFTY